MKIKPFKGWRPKPEFVEQVASRPYDVLNSTEARTEAKDNPLSFLNVVKPEITLPPKLDPHDPQVYRAGKKNFDNLVSDGVFVQDKTASYYIYELTMNGHTQAGILAGASIDDYNEGKIKKHEQTTPDKEADRTTHVLTTMMNAEPVFFAYKATQPLDDLISEIRKSQPVYDFITTDGIIHKLWIVDDQPQIDQISSAFEQMEATYVADGHHRTAAAANAGAELRKANPNHTGGESYNYFMAVHFPDNQLQILDYNRVIKDLNGHSTAKFLLLIEQDFIVELIGKKAHKPQTLHEFSMFLDGNWYKLTARHGRYDDNDPIKSLDVTVLSDYLLKPHLDIVDLRKDKRIEFVGGIRGMVELEKRVTSGEMAVAFGLYPVSMQQLMKIADNNLTMPPKVTWFEPKLRSGLVVKTLE